MVGYPICGEALIESGLGSRHDGGLDLDSSAGQGHKLSLALLFGMGSVLTLPSLLVPRKTGCGEALIESELGPDMGCDRWWVVLNAVRH